MEQIQNSLNVISNIEPGCLGPQGKIHIDVFCRYAQKHSASDDLPFIDWTILPRHDKSVAEVQYRFNNKNLSREQAARYLEIHKSTIDDLEALLDEKIVQLIEQYQAQF